MVSESGAQGGAVIPWIFCFDKAHGLLMALTQCHDEVARPRLVNSEADGSGAVWDTVKGLAFDSALGFSASGHFSEDISERFRAGVFGSEDGEIGELSGHFGHQAAFGGVAQASRTKEDDDAATGNVPSRLQDAGESVGGVSKITKSAKILAHVDDFNTARNAGRARARQHGSDGRWGSGNRAVSKGILVVR